MYAVLIHGLTPHSYRLVPEHSSPQVQLEEVLNTVNMRNIFGERCMNYIEHMINFNERDGLEPYVLLLLNVHTYIQYNAEVLRVCKSNGR